jgi:signal transduction histidine kinase
MSASITAGLPPITGNGGRLRRLARSEWTPLVVGGATAAVLVVVFSAWLMLQPGGARVTSLVDDALIPLVAFAAAATTLRAAIQHLGALRFAWVMIGASCAAWGAGEAIWGYYDAVLGVAVPFPSIADVGYLASIPLGVAGILGLRSFREGLATEVRGIVDGLIIATALLLISWLTALGAVFASSGDSVLTQVISLSYPVGDIVSLTMVALVVARSRPESRLVTMLVGAGFATIAVTDSLFSLLNARGIYTTGSPIDAGWLLSFCLIGLAPLAIDPAAKSGRLRLPRLVPWLAMTLPVAFAVLAIGGEAVAFALGARPDAVTNGCVLVMCGLVVARIAASRLANQEVDDRQRTAQVALRESEQALWDVVRDAPFGIVVIDRQGFLRSCFGQVLTALHPNPQSLVGTAAADLMADAAASEALSSALSGIAATARIRRGTAELQLVVTPSSDWAGKPNGAIAVVHDVGEHQRALEVHREAEQRSRYVSQMSHEIRNPLNAVLGYSELLSRPEAGALNEKQARYLDNVWKSGQFLLAIVNDVLDLAKAEAGRIEFSAQSFDVLEAVEDAVTLLHPIADRAGVTLEIESGGPVECFADPGRTQQVLVNLLSNAIKFTRPASTVRIATTAADGQVRIDFLDQGVGIPAGQLERIFEELVQVAGQNSELRGTGLGLPLSRGLARGMGGDVTVRSTVGEGSTFALALPSVAVQQRVA